MRSILLISALLFSAAAFAQEVDPAASFPSEAITEVQQPTQPGLPSAPANPNSANVPPSPKAPVQPVGPINELWPSDTVKQFVLPCTQGNVQLITPCRCVIENLMKTMTHREFMEISQRSAMAKDVRYTAARQQCALKTQANRKKQ